MDPALADLHEVITLGLARGGALLTAGEHAVARHILALDEPVAALYARLSARVPDTFRDEPGADALIEAGLADRLVPWRVRAERLTVPELADACRALGLPRTGRKADLVARLAPHTGWHPSRWIRILHKPLLRRLERFAFLDAFPDRATLVVARMGVVRWPEYALTPGPALFRDRRALLAWERLLAGVDADAALAALAAGAGRAPGGLDLVRHLRRAVRESARARERVDPEAAAAAYRRLAEHGERPARVAFRRARVEEACGRAREALAVLRDAMPSALPSEQLELARAGRRVARALRTGFAPPRPLAVPRTRDLRLVPGEPVRGRPTWLTADGPRPVEDAVVAALAAAGRVAVHGEGQPWCTLVALLLADLYFLPVPGALPVRFLAGPLDLGTPAFRRSRADAVRARLDAIAAGAAPDLVRAADARWRGVRLAGARWDVPPDLLLALAAAPPAALRVLVETIADAGFRASAGLPDLVVLPGPDARLDGALPSRVPPGLLLAEVKGPGDQLRDEQLVWLDRLASAGLAAEVWHVAPAAGWKLVGGSYTALA